MQGRGRRQPCKNAVHVLKELTEARVKAPYDNQPGHGTFVSAKPERHRPAPTPQARTRNRLATLRNPGRGPVARSTWFLFGQAVLFIHAPSVFFPDILEIVPCGSQRFSQSFFFCPGEAGPHATQTNQGSWLASHRERSTCLGQMQVSPAQGSTSIWFPCVGGDPRCAGSSARPSWLVSSPLIGGAAGAPRERCILTATCFLPCEPLFPLGASVYAESDSPSQKSLSAKMEAQPLSIVRRHTHSLASFSVSRKNSHLHLMRVTCTVYRARLIFG